MNRRHHIKLLFLILLAPLLCGALMLRFQEQKRLQEKHRQRPPLTQGVGDRKISWGSGGGVTGRYETFDLHEDGRITHSVFPEDTSMMESELPGISIDDATELFARADEEDLASIALNQPSNMTSFLTIPTPSGSTTHLAWQSGPAPVAKVEDFIRDLQKLIQPWIDHRTKEAMKRQQEELARLPEPVPPTGAEVRALMLKELAKWDKELSEPDRSPQQREFIERQKVLIQQALERLNQSEGTKP